MIPIYLYLAIYGYAYSSSTYDIVVAPIFHVFIEYHADLLIQVEREKTRIKIL